MASLLPSAVLSNTKLSITAALDASGHLQKDASFNERYILSLKSKKSDLTVSRVATKPIVAVPAKESDTQIIRDKVYTAWTSIRQERWEGELDVEGHLPLWLNGTYLRNGPGLWNIGDYKFRHLFDGYAMLVGLHFKNGRLTAGHRQIESDAYKAAKKNKKLCYREFSEVPQQENFLSYMGDLAGLFSGASLFSIIHG